MHEMITPERQKVINAWNEFKKALLETIEPFLMPIIIYLDNKIKKFIK